MVTSDLLEAPLLLMVVLRSASTSNMAQCVTPASAEWKPLLCVAS